MPEPRCVACPSGKQLSQNENYDGEKLSQDVVVPDAAPPPKKNVRVRQKQVPDSDAKKKSFVDDV